MSIDKKYNPSVPLWEVPRMWAGETVVCIGGGPSVSANQVELIHGKAKVIAISDAYRVAPWADVLYSCHKRWWDWHDGAKGFEGIKVGLRGSKDGIGFEDEWDGDVWPDVKDRFSQ